MNWTMVGALGEFFGAIAVVASLLYMGHQVRQNNWIASAEAYLLRHAAMIRVFEAVYRQVSQGVLNTGALDILPRASSPPFQDSWMALGESYSPDFRSFFESRYRFDNPTGGEADRA